MIEMKTAAPGLVIQPPAALSASRGRDGMVKGPDGGEKEELARAVHDFEALFIDYMLKTMRSTLQKSGLLGNGLGGDIYASLFDWEVAREMARSGGLGLGSMLLKDLGPAKGSGAGHPGGSEVVRREPAQGAGEDGLVYER